MESQSVVVKLTGDFDAHNAPELHRLLEPARESRYVVVDFSATGYVDSSCLTELAITRRVRIERGLPSMRLVVATPNMQKLLHIVGFDLVFPLYSTLEEALRPSGFAHK